MIRGRRTTAPGTPAPAAPASPRVEPVETAWRIHAALTDWTGKVDGKASFALTVEAALLAGVVGLSQDDARFAMVRPGWERNTYWLGVGLLVAAVLLATSVVTPHLRSRHAKAESANNLVYFGHLRHWEPERLAQALEHRAVLPVLSRQLVAMSQIAWRKHRRVQVSLWLAVAGTVVLAFAAATPSLGLV